MLQGVYLATTEKTQKFALRVCTREWSASYPDLLECCQVPTLSARRTTAKLCHLYKIIYGLADCEMAPIVQRVPKYSCRRSNPVQLKSLFAHTSHFQFSYYSHSIVLWNDLSVNANDLSSSYVQKVVI